MKTDEKELKNEDFKVLLKKLSLILTLPEQDVQALTRKWHDQAGSVAEALEAAGVSGNRQWLGNSMASLPLENWVRQENTLHTVKPTKDASLRYLLQEVDADDEEVTKHLKSRKVLYDELAKHLGDMPPHFAPMLKWTKLYRQYPINVDIALGRTIDMVETVFMKAYSVNEHICRKVNLSIDALDVPTPIRFIPLIAEKSFEDSFVFLETITEGTEEQFSEDHLVARVMCNVAANRVLLERARFAKQAKLAAVVNVKLLEALNKKGIFEVPEVYNDEDIKRVLSELFGKNGSVFGEGGTTRFLSGDDLEVAFSTAKREQNHYLVSRGRPGLSLHPNAHSTPEDTMMFALVQVGLFDQRSKIDNEFRGEDPYAVFPGRGTPAREGLPRSQALELGKTMYSQMAFSNIGWDLSAANVRDYELAMAEKRDYLMMLIFDVFKGWTTGKLWALHEAMSDPEMESAFGQNPVAWI
jgi:hypothetical protein